MVPGLLGDDALMSPHTLPVAAGVAALAAVVTALFGQLTWAVALLGLAGVFTAATLWRMARRHAQVHQQLTELAEQVRLAADRLETAQSRTRRRLVGAAQQLRDSGAEHRDAVLQAIETVPKTTQTSVATSLHTLAGQLVKHQGNQTRELEALLQLLGQITPRAPLPSSGQWALDPRGLLELWHILDTRRPARVLELGGGTSSVWIAYALERHQGRLVSLDHDEGFADKTRQQLYRHGLDRVAEVRHAPLKPVEVNGDTYEWYDVTACDDLSEVDLLLVDGPPGRTGPRARYPAVPLLVDRLAAEAMVLLDDCDRPDEQAVLQSWLTSIPGLVQQPATIGNLAVLRYRR